MYLQLKNLLLQQHLLRRPKAASKVTKVIIKATTRVVTNFSTKGTKVLIKGGTRAREKDTRVAANGVTMAQKVMLANQLQLMVMILLVNMIFPKNIRLLYPHRFQQCPVVDSKWQQ